MFEGVQDQFHQFPAAPPSIRASPSSLPFSPLSFSLLHGCTSSSSSNSPNSFPIFDPYPPPPFPQAQLLPPTHQHHHYILQQPLHLQFSRPGGVKQEGLAETTSGFLSTSLVLEQGRSTGSDSIDPWSHDEVLALLRIRSAVESWFPEFTWEHVSRKLAEIGFKRSPQKCKEKFEEENRYLHTNTATSSIATDSCPTKNYRLFSELEELYHHGHDPPPPPPPPPPLPHHHQQPSLIPRDGCEDQNKVVLVKQNPQGKEQEQEQEDGHDEQEQLGGEGQEEEREEGQDKMGQEILFEENDGSEATGHRQIVDKIDEETKMERKKRRSHHRMKFEIFQSFCKELMNKMMAQQEELHIKILNDMIKRDEEEFAREEAWKKQGIERINRETEARARDQAMVTDRQAKIIEFLKKFRGICPNQTLHNTPTHQNPSSSATHSSPNQIPTSSNDESFSQNSNSALDSSQKQPNPRKSNKRPYSDISIDTFKRWPRDEVLALINIRCNIDQNNNAKSDDHSKNTPLWERISQRMSELGYQRSAKRCKEKWENINKYFRKTKDVNKKRSVDSRTCPYFHQLSHLYSQGRVMGCASGGGSASGAGTGGVGAATTANVGDQGDQDYVVQVTTPACGFEF